MHSKDLNGGERVIQSLADNIVHDGFTMLSRALDPGLLQRIQGPCVEMSRAMRAQLEGRNIGIGSAAGYDEIVQRSPGRWDVPIAPSHFGFDEREAAWWPLVTTLLGPDAEHFFSGVVLSEPDSPAQYWHTDSPHECVQHRPAHAINVLVALHDIPMAMGPTEVARGSHYLTNHLSNPSLVLNELIYQHADSSPAMLVRDRDTPEPRACSSAMEAGDCLVFDDRILHRGLANNSKSTRYVAYFAYRRMGYSTNTHFEASRSVFDHGQ